MDNIGDLYYHSVLGKHPCNYFGNSNGKHPGNVSQDHSDDKANENTYEDDGDVDDLDPFSDSDE